MTSFGVLLSGGSGIVAPSDPKALISGAIGVDKSPVGLSPPISKWSLGEFLCCLFFCEFFYLFIFPFSQVISIHLNR